MRKKRLVTKCDIDGLVSGTLLKEVGLVDSIHFCHPKDIEIGKVIISESDVTAALPYREEVHLAFDHYTGQMGANNGGGNRVVDQGMPSTARVIFNHYGQQALKNLSGDLVRAADKGVSAEITIDDILYPSGWTLLTYLIDQRTGLDNFSNFSISTSELVEKLTDWCREYTVWELLDLPDVEERLDNYFSSMEQYKSQIMRCSTVHNNLVVVDLREEATIYPGNRFMVYALFPECNVSLQLMHQPTEAKTIFVAGRSFIDKTFTGDIGEIMRMNGGGGHARAGTCRAEDESATEVLNGLIKSMKYGVLKNLVMGYYH